MGMVSLAFEYMRRGKFPRKGDKLVMPCGCYREIVNKEKDTLTSTCSNPKTCPSPDHCDLSKATIVRSGKELK